MLRLHTLPAYKGEVEVVERKGLGHPDTLADSIAERASADYSKYFYSCFGGRFAHHWFDKVVLMGGESSIEYGRGELVKPYEVLFFGKGVKRVGDRQVPVKDIFNAAASSVLGEVLSGFESEKHLLVVDRVSDYKGPGQRASRYRPKEESELFDLRNSSARSNDCNVCISYWPLSVLENLVLNLERHLNSEHFKKLLGNCSGSDIKIVGQRVGEDFGLLVNFPFIARGVYSWDDYVEKVNFVETYISTYTEEHFGIRLNQLTINPERKQNRPYLTVLGTVADTGDIGVVGRGNRSNGLISPTRSMSIEAWAGKNPIDHTGKLYTFLADEIAKEIYEATGKGNQVILTSSKEAPVEKPDLISVGLYDNEVLQSKDIERIICSIIDKKLGSIRDLTLKCIFGTLHCKRN